MASRLKQGDARRRLLELQQRIYGSLQRDARGLLGAEPASIRRYQREFERDFRVSQPRLSDKDDLIAQIRRADVTFVADFHTFQQAQRTALRLIREACQPGEPWMIGLELVPSRFQPALDEFQRGKLSLEDFHRLIQYRDEWGFPWRHYAPLFEWARAHGVRLVALNLPKEFASLRHQSDLHARDRWAAGLITDLLSLHAGLRMIVLYGELHVASAHLPAQLEKVTRSFWKRGRKVKSVIVHQNHDGLYWRLARRGLEHEANVVRLKSGRYCVFSSTPWHKLQSLVSWAESDSPTTLAGDWDEGWEDGTETDYVSVLENYGRTICELLGMTAPSFETLTVRTIDQAELLDRFLEDPAFSASERHLIRSRVTRNRRLYVSRAKLAYLGSPSTNGAAELAATHIMNSVITPYALQIRTPEEFARAVMVAAFAFFGSLVINPRRKCDLPADHQRALRRLRQPMTDDPVPVKARMQEIRARTLALALFKAEARTRRSGKLQIREFQQAMTGRSTEFQPVLLEAARYVGRVLGRRTHQALIEGTLDAARIRELFLNPARDWEVRLAHLFSAAAPAQLAPSKQDVF